MLGPVEIRTGGGRVDAGPSRQRGVLAAIAVDAGQPVLVDTVIDRVWGREPPDRARHALYVHITRIRRLLGEVAGERDTPARLLRRGGGYLLDVDPGDVDVHRFRSLAEAAGRPERPDTQRVHLLRQALGLWRGTPLGDLPGEWAARMRERWQRQRVDAAISWARAELRLGNVDRIIDPLGELVAEVPHAEPLVAMLMWALHSAGRRAEALDCYTTARRRLADELGVDPGAELRAVYEAILREDLEPPIPRLIGQLGSRT